MTHVAWAAVGLVLFVLGVASGIPALVVSGVSVDAVAGTVAAGAGLVVLVVAVFTMLRGRRARVKLLIVPFALVVAQWLLVPAVNAGLVTHAPHEVALAPAGVRSVTFAASDGVRIAAWLAPSGRDAVVLLHGSHGSRADVVAHLRFLHQAGFTVLALDSRGHGASGGRTNALGWDAERDLEGAVDYLHRSGYRHVAALGLSMGAEIALRAASDGVPLSAVVADGAGASTLGDDRLLTHGPLAPVERSVMWLTMRGVEMVSGAAEPRPLSDVVAGIRAPVLLIASNRAGELTIDGVYRDRIGSRAKLWHVSDAGHTRALAAHPAAYADRVDAFLHAGFSVR